MDQSELNPVELRCNICNRSFSSANALMEHRRTHTGERPYTCPICHKCFTQKGHLNIHKRTHTGEKPYACHICNKRFAQSSHLNTHKRIHTGEKPYYCNICNIGFSRKQRLELHVVQHMQDGTCPPDFAGFGDNDDATITFPDIGQNMVAKISPQGGSEKTNEIDLPNITSPLRRRKPAFVTRISSEDEDAMAVKDGGDSADIKPPVDILSNKRIKQEIMEPMENRDNHLLSLFLGERETSGAGFTDVVSDGNEETKKGETLKLPKAISDSQNNISGDDNDAVSITSESNHSSSDISIPISCEKRSMLSYSNIGQKYARNNFSPSHTHPRQGPTDSPAIRTNNRICLVDFSTEDLLTHLMSRDDVHKCDYCCVIFQDAAMYHLHRSMHEKMDIRSCNLCGKPSQDKYDFTAHFLSEHK